MLILLVVMMLAGLISIFMSWFSILLILVMMLLISYYQFSMVIYWDIYNSMWFMDFFSFILVLMTIWVIFLMFCVEEEIYLMPLMKKFLFMLMCIFLILFFYTSDYFLMYVFFEVTLLPIMFLIFFYGVQMERLKAGLYMLMYTLFASLPLLVLLIILKKSNILMMNYFFIISKMKFFINFQMLILLFAFLVKLPVYGVHVWLPKAHVEAPLVGSMILAGVLLKMGGYGLYRICLLSKLMSLTFLGHFFMSLGLMGGLLISVVCFRQVDLKVMIAYSSVSHMSMVLGGFLTFSFFGFMGSLMMMVGHGFCSSLMFFVANIFYTRFYTRSVFLLSGLNLIFPSLMYMWFFISVINMGAPPSMNFIAELLLISSMIKWSVLNMVLLFFLSLMVTGYCIYIFVKIMHGKLWFFYSMSNINKKEYYLILSHLIPLFLFLFKIEVFLVS